MARTPEEIESIRERSTNYLTMLGLGHLASQTLRGKDGSPIVREGRELKADQFLEVCENEAGPYLETFKNMPEDDPRRPMLAEGLRQAVSQYIEIDPEMGAPEQA